MKPPLKRVWRFARWPLGVLLVLYVGFVLYRIPAVGEKERTVEAVAHIHAQKITLDDVMGAHLPPTPNEEENNATLAGVDANKNGIRDDVELAIFKKYPDSPRIRAAELQYAKALQMELTEVSNSETLVAVIQQVSRGSLCIATTRSQLKDSFQTTTSLLNSVSESKFQIESLIFNNSERKNTRENFFNKFMTSYSDVNSEACDLSLLRT